MFVYGLRDIKHGTGFNRDARFVEVNDERLRLIASAPALVDWIRRALATAQMKRLDEALVDALEADARALLATIDGKDI